MPDPYIATPFKKDMIPCDFASEYEIITYYIRPSTSVIIIKSKETGDKYVVKFLHIIGEKYSFKQNSINIEIEQLFSAFLTEKILDKNVSPHIIRCHQSDRPCDGLDILIKKLVNRECPTRKERINNDIDNDWAKNYCDIVNRVQSGVLKDSYKSIIVQYWGTNFGSYIKNNKYIQKLSDAEHYMRDSIHRIVEENIDTIMFQIIFTLAAIRSKYHGFSHGNLSNNNVVIDTVKNYQENEYCSYHIRGKTFYMKCNGPHAKLIDFRYSKIAEGKVGTETEGLGMDDVYGDICEYELCEKKSDYSDTWAIICGTIWRLTDTQCDSCHLVANMLEKYANMEFFDESIRIVMKYSTSSYVDGLDIVMKSVMTPEQYIDSDIFDRFSTKPSNADIIHSFNK